MFSTIKLYTGITELLLAISVAFLYQAAWYPLVLNFITCFHAPTINFVAYTVFMQLYFYDGADWALIIDGLAAFA